MGFRHLLATLIPSLVFPSLLFVFPFLLFFSCLFHFRTCVIMVTSNAPTRQNSALRQKGGHFGPDKLTSVTDPLQFVLIHSTHLAASASSTELRQSLIAHLQCLSLAHEVPLCQDIWPDLETSNCAFIN